MKTEKLLIALKQRKFLVLSAVVLVGLLVLTKAGLPYPPAVEKRSIARLTRELKARNSSADRWRRALWNLTPSRMEGMRHFLQPTDYRSLHLQAAIELGARGASASNAVSALVWAVGHDDAPDIHIVHEELLALGRIGPAARQAVPELLKWLTRPDPGPWPGLGIWKQGAAWALARIAPEDARVAAALVSALALCGTEDDYAYLDPAGFTEPTDLRDWPSSAAHGLPSTKRSLIRAIGRLRPQTPQTLAALFYQLDHGDYGAQATAADALGEPRPASRDTIAQLKDALLRTGDEHLPAHRDLVALATANLVVHARRVGFPLAMIKVNPDPEVGMVFSEAPSDPLEKWETIYVSGEGFPGWGLRLRVIRALGRIGPRAREVVPLLLRECENRTNALRFDAAVAAWRINGESPEVVATFEQGLHAASLESRQFAIARLREIGAESPKALALLIEGLDDLTIRVRVQTVDSLAALGTNAVQALPTLGALVNDPVFLVRIATTQALQAILSARPGKEP